MIKKSEKEVLFCTGYWKERNPSFSVSAPPNGYFRTSPWEVRNARFSAFFLLWPKD